MKSMKEVRRQGKGKLKSEAPCIEAISRMEAIDITSNPKFPEVVEWTIPGLTRFQAAQYRKILFEEIQTWSVDAVEIFMNESSVFDEIVILHLGLIPILASSVPENAQRANVKDSTYGIDGNWSGANVELGVKSDAFGLVVTSSMIRSSVKFIPNVPILALPPNSRFAAKMYLQLGVGKTHSKWSPVTMVLPYQVENGFRFRVELRGNLDFNDLITASIPILEARIQNSFPS